MDSLKNILEGRGPAEPDEIKLIKRYVNKKYKASVSVTVGPKQIVIISPSAALAGSLRLEGREIAKFCNTEKRLVFRIGQ